MNGEPSNSVVFRPDDEMMMKPSRYMNWMVLLTIRLL